MKRSTMWPHRFRSSEPVPMLTSGFAVGGLRRMIGAGAAVVVRVDVEHDERAETSEVVEEAVEPFVERVVQTTRALHLLLGERLAPHLEAPRRLRVLVHALAARAVEVHLEAGPVDDDGQPTGARDAVGEGVLLASPRQIIQGDLLGHLGAKVVPRVDGCHHER